MTVTNVYCIGLDCCDINVLIDCNIEVVLLLLPCVEVVLSSLLFRRNSVARYVKHTELTASNIIILCLEL